MYMVPPFLQVSHPLWSLSASTRYLGLARISQAGPWPKSPRPPLSFLCSIWRFLDTPRHLESRAWGSQEDTHTEHLSLGYISCWYRFPPSSAASSPERLHERSPRPLTRNPTLGSAGSRSLALRYGADLWQYISTKTWLIPTPRTTAWTSCDFE